MTGTHLKHPAVIDELKEMLASMVEISNPENIGVGHAQGPHTEPA